MTIINSIKIKGFKSIKSLDLKLNPLNILIGPNGAGKTNFISAFKFLNQLVNKNLQHYIIESGGAENFLYFGSKTTTKILFNLNFGVNTYNLELKLAIPNTLSIEETGSFDGDKAGYQGGKKLTKIASPDGLETGLPAPGVMTINENIARHLDGLTIYHFHDTSNTANLKSTSGLNDNISLHSDAGNLASMLYKFKQFEYYNYTKIVDSIRLVAPFFQDFILEPDENRNILPRWKHKGSEKAWDFYSLSDGTLRFICLATLLQQPLDFIPPTILIDEPELGLHPDAIKILAELMKSVTKQGKQIIASTQSVTLINEFLAEDILVADRNDNQTIIRRLTEGEIKDWIDEYSLGTIWEKNIIGGTPDDF